MVFFQISTDYWKSNQNKELISYSVVSEYELQTLPLRRNSCICGSFCIVRYLLKKQPLIIHGRCEYGRGGGSKSLEFTHSFQTVTLSRSLSIKRIILEWGPLRNFARTPPCMTKVSQIAALEFHKSIVLNHRAERGRCELYIPHVWVAWAAKICSDHCKTGSSEIIREKRKMLGFTGEEVCLNEITKRLGEG